MSVLDMAITVLVLLGLSLIISLTASSWPELGLRIQK